MGLSLVTSRRCLLEVEPPHPSARTTGGGGEGIRHNTGNKHIVAPITPPSVTSEAQGFNLSVCMSPSVSSHASSRVCLFVSPVYCLYCCFILSLHSVISSNSAPGPTVCLSVCPSLPVSCNNLSLFPVSVAFCLLCCSRRATDLPSGLSQGPLNSGEVT